MNYVKALAKVMKPIKYNGVNIHQGCGKFSVYGKTYNSLPEAQKAVDASYKSLQNSLR